DGGAGAAAGRCRPLLERPGRDRMRLPDPGRGHRRDLPALLKETPALAVIVDTFEQRAQRPQRRQRAYYSGKKKAHTLKSQVAVDEDGDVVDVAGRRPGGGGGRGGLPRRGVGGRGVGGGGEGEAGGGGGGGGRGLRRLGRGQPAAARGDAAAQAAREGAADGRSALQPGVRAAADHGGARHQPAAPLPGAEPG